MTDKHHSSQKEQHRGNNTHGNTRNGVQNPLVNHPSTDAEKLRSEFHQHFVSRTRGKLIPDIEPINVKAPAVEKHGDATDENGHLHHGDQNSTGLVQRIHSAISDLRKEIAWLLEETTMAMILHRHVDMDPTIKSLPTVLKQCKSLIDEIDRQMSMIMMMTQPSSQERGGGDASHQWQRMRAFVYNNAAKALFRLAVIGGPVRWVTLYSVDMQQQIMYRVARTVQLLLKLGYWTKEQHSFG